jgi:hypothetical protein
MGIERKKKCMKSNAYTALNITKEILTDGENKTCPVFVCIVSKVGFISFFKQDVDNQCAFL